MNLYDRFRIKMHMLCNRVCMVDSVGEQIIETAGRDAWQKCLQGLIKQTTAGSSCLLKKKGPMEDYR